MTQTAWIAIDVAIVIIGCIGLAYVVWKQSNK